MIAKCYLCPFTARFNCKLEVHQLAVHSDLKPWPCMFPECDHRTKTKFHLQLHIRRKHETNPELRKPFFCTVEGCDYRSAEKSKVNSHASRMHNPDTTRNFECALCPSRFSSKSGLNAHIRNHVMEKKHKCNHCDFTTHQVYYLTRHVRDVHQKLRTFTCAHPGCNFSTHYKSGFNQHSKRHDPDVLVRLPVACNYSGCDYRARNASRLREHTFRRHDPTRTKGFMCPFCAKAFKEETSLTHHMKTVHLNEKAYKCEKCDYATASSAALKSHQQRKHGKGHPKTKNFGCDSCVYRAVCQSELDFHVRTVHMKDWRFSCRKPGCSYRTYHSVSFKNHLLAQEEDPEKHFPLACTFPNCDFRRMTKPEMKAHERIHKVSELKLKCRICRRGNYPDTQSLNFHIRTYHVELAAKGQNKFIQVPIVRLERICVKEL